jgi:hypothetical protein
MTIALTFRQQVGGKGIKLFKKTGKHGSEGADAVQEMVRKSVVGRGSNGRRMNNAFLMGSHLELRSRSHVISWHVTRV